MVALFLSPKFRTQVLILIRIVRNFSYTRTLCLNRSLSLAPFRHNASEIIPVLLVARKLATSHNTEYAKWPLGIPRRNPSGHIAYSEALCEMPDNFFQ